MFNVRCRNQFTPDDVRLNYMAYGIDIRELPPHERIKFMPVDYSNLHATLLELSTREAFIRKTEMVGAFEYDIFTYRIASYSDFCLDGALECRGHTFLKIGSIYKLVSLPMEKFFNLHENPFTESITLDDVVEFQEKLDGSLISSVWNSTGELLLKTKGTFKSEQAIAARDLLLHDINFIELLTFVQEQTRQQRTVNMEYTAPSNQIVVYYDDYRLRVLNVRDNLTGAYVPISGLSDEFIAKSLPVEDFVNINKWNDCEGVVGVTKSGQRFKLKSDWYSLLHKTKDQMTSFNIFCAGLQESTDDLISMFTQDSFIQHKITRIKAYSERVMADSEDALIAFYDEHELLDRKEYAIAAQKALKPLGLFGCAMLLYDKRDSDLIEVLKKLHKDKLETFWEAV